MTRKFAAAWRALRTRLRAARVKVRQWACHHRFEIAGLRISPNGPITVRGCVRCRVERIGIGGRR